MCAWKRNIFESHTAERWVSEVSTQYSRSSKSKAFAAIISSLLTDTNYFDNNGINCSAYYSRCYLFRIAVTVCSCCDERISILRRHRFGACWKIRNFVKLTKQKWTRNIGHFISVNRNGAPRKSTQRCRALVALIDFSQFCDKSTASRIPLNIKRIAVSLFAMFLIPFASRESVCVVCRMNNSLDRPSLSLSLFRAYSSTRAFEDISSAVHLSQQHIFDILSGRCQVVFLA